MNSFEPTPSEPDPLLHRHSRQGANLAEDQPALATDTGLTPIQALRRRIFFRTLAILFPLALVLLVAAFFAGRHWVRQSLNDSLPQLDGSLVIPGLSAPVTVLRDAQGVPHIRAASLDDLLVAQGYVTAQDRLWQMETLRRHAAGTLAEVLGPALIPHDRVQRTLQIRASADRALATLPPEQLHWFELYARGVNASITAQRPHLPLEFRLLRFEPAPWTPRDTILVGLAMFQDLTNTFTTKLNREALTAKLPANLVADLYPVGSWRDHPPAQPIVDLTAPQTDIPDIPLDESQTKLTPPASPHGAVAQRETTASTKTLLALQKLTAPILACDGCIAGSNNWAVAGARTASGKPMLSNDMHLAHSVPGVWYETDLQSPTPNGSDLHATGVSLPGVPFIIVGHNAHIAWGFTNLGADVQDVYIEHTRGTGNDAQFQTTGGDWNPILHQHEIIHVKGAKDIDLDVVATRHGTAITPILSNLLAAVDAENRGKTNKNTDKRTLSLRWTIYDPANITPSFFAIDTASDWASLCDAFSTFGGPAQNLMYADDQGHIGYHAVGKIPIRGSLANPSPISPVPADALDPTQQWDGTIPFGQLPQAFDPPNGILATANARVTPDGYPFPVTLDWAAPYRNERIWKVLSSRDHLTPADMLALQTDVYSDVDHVIAQRLSYAIDHTSTNDKRLHQAADLLRDWNGNVDADSAAAAIADAARIALWPLLLEPHLGPHPGDDMQLYTWGEKSYAEEWLVMHTPSRWLPSRYATWDDLLTAAVSKGLLDAHAPYDLSKWRYGKANPIDIKHPIFSQSPILQRLIGMPTGTGPQPENGDATTVKQIGRTLSPSERFTADLSDLDHSTLNLILGQSGNPASPWFMNQWPAWYKGTTFNLPFSKAAVDAATTHTLTLTPQ